MATAVRVRGQNISFNMFVFAYHSTGGRWAFGFLHLHIIRHGGARFSTVSCRSTWRRWVVSHLCIVRNVVELLFVREVGLLAPSAAGSPFGLVYTSSGPPRCCSAVLVVVI